MSKRKNREARAAELDPPDKSPFPPPPLPTTPVEIRWYSVPIVDWKEAGPDVKAYLRLMIFGNLDSALAAGGEVLDGPLHPVQRGVIERTMAIVRKARDLHNPFEANSPEVHGACVRLEVALAEVRGEARTNKRKAAMAAAGRIRNRTPEIEARHKRILETCANRGRSIDEHGLAGWLVDEYGAPETKKELDTLTRQINRDLKNLRTHQRSVLK